MQRKIRLAQHIGQDVAERPMAVFSTSPDASGSVLIPTLLHKVIIIIIIIIVDIYFRRRVLWLQ